MADVGWIKLHRKIQDCHLWSDKPFDKARAWIDLLLCAMHHDKKLLIDGNIVVIPRGSFLTTRGKLAEKWGWSIKKVDKYLKLLENEKMVTTKRTPKGTTLTIVNYEEYQLAGTTEDTLKDTTEDITEGTTEDTQNKNVKNYKNEREYNARTQDEIQPLPFDAEKVWKDTFAIYPKKGNAHSSKMAWLDFLKDILPSNQLDVAKLIFCAIKLYLADYKKKNPDDEDYRFIPRFDKWLKEDCKYWISVYEEQQRDK